MYFYANKVLQIKLLQNIVFVKVLGYQTCDLEHVCGTVLQRLIRKKNKMQNDLLQFKWKVFFKKIFCSEL